MTPDFSPRTPAFSTLALCVAAWILATGHPAQGQSPNGDTRPLVLTARDTPVGRVVAQETTRVLTKRGELIDIDVPRIAVTRTRITGIPAGEAVAGLGTLGGTDLYTVGGTRALLTIRDGRVAVRKELEATHFDLFGWTGGLFVQALPLAPGGPALWALADPGGTRVPVGHLTVRSTSGPRVLTWARSFIRCGLPAPDVVPCWNAFEVGIDPISARSAPVVRLADLETSAPTDLQGTPDRWPRPIRDVAVLPGGAFLVLTPGRGSAASADARELRRYARDGRLLAAGWLPVPGRFFVRVVADKVWLVSTSGHLIEAPLP